MLKLVIRIVLVAYAALVAILGQYAALDSADLGYSPFLVALTSASALALGTAILIVVFEWSIPCVLRHWKLAYWLSCIDLLIGTAQDWRSMSGHLGIQLLVTLVVLVFLGPAYYFSYVLAYPRRSTPPAKEG